MSGQHHKLFISKKSKAQYLYNKKRRWPNILLPVVIRMATVAQNVVTEIANTATDNAPMYIAATKDKNRAKNPPIDAKDMRNNTKMALIVAAKKKSMNTSSPVKETRMVVPTCSNKEKEIINIQIDGNKLTEMTNIARRGLPR
ncbi:hypothetical protein Lal_00001433 [Lupinus albus]|nr:hypothetical protein Lal_00001433 [Lupinus albus]